MTDGSEPNTIECDMTDGEEIFPNPTGTSCHISKKDNFISHALRAMMVAKVLQQAHCFASG